MSRRSSRRKQRQSRSLAFPIAVVVSLVALVGLAALLVRGAASDGPGLPLGTNNVMGLASAPVEVEEWGDFQ